MFAWEGEELADHGKDESQRSDPARPEEEPPLTGFKHCDIPAASTSDRPVLALIHVGIL
jgi:hypothetical protein